MTVRVLLFAAAREAAGTGALDLDLPDGATVSDAWELLADAHPALAPVLRTSRAAVDEAFVPASTVLRDGAELAVLPPVSGG